MFKVGDIVKGNTNHINHLRMNDLGVVTRVDTERCDCWVTWESDEEEHFAPYYELTLVDYAE